MKRVVIVSQKHSSALSPVNALIIILFFIDAHLHYNILILTFWSALRRTDTALPWDKNKQTRELRNFLQKSGI